MIINASAVLISRGYGKEQEYLLVQEGEEFEELHEKWNFPAGRVDPGESILACATREGNEETGYILQVTGLIVICQQMKLLGEHDVLAHVFEAKIIGGEKIIPSDLLDVRWFSFQEIQDMSSKGQLVSPYVLDAINIHRQEDIPSIPIDSNHIRIYFS
jgi:8-oxo-dGTP pyrophosphatase MutT (NUDIX family)